MATRPLRKTATLVLLAATALGAAAEVRLAPYGRLRLVDAVDCARPDPNHALLEVPAGVSRVETLLGRRARVVPPQTEQASAVTVRLGRGRGLQAGRPYVLLVEYPQDAPRCYVVINTGNETSRGFHTGPTVGDALHPKYVDNCNESLDLPLSQRWETWSLLFFLHDRFPERGLVRGPQPRPLAPADGFDVTVAQFSAKNLPLSRGLALAGIRLYEVLDPNALPLARPALPPDLPHRRLCWREEMSDGVLDRKSPQPGIARPLDWFRYKAERMRFLGMNTYTKDLLEFGACQHWDSGPYGGNDWVYHDRQTRGLWAEVVGLMGRHGFEILPYYEYSGSKGRHGLGNERRARPLTRDDAYTHITWVESANADVTDPDTLVDFAKMLDLTVLRLRDRARFAGVWIRPRGQLPVSFSAAARARFAQDTGVAAPVTREQLRADETRYRAYLAWWQGRRRAFLTGVRDHLTRGGLTDPLVLFTGCAAEPGVPFATWERRLVTDIPSLWTDVVTRPEQQTGRGALRLLTVDQVVREDLYLKALLAPRLTWGAWEVQHAYPADDPEHYRNTPGVLLTHAFNRAYTVSSPRTFAAYRGPSGLALVRYYSLNENMMVDANDHDLLGYFVTDMEYAGPACMQAEVRAMAAGDPTLIAYLAGNNFGRGFPGPVRRFNAHFLALPALPSRILSAATDAPQVTVRRIDTARHGTWLAVIHTGRHTRTGVTIRVPAGRVTDAVTGTPLPVTGGRLRLDLGPHTLRSLHVTDTGS